MKPNKPHHESWEESFMQIIRDNWHSGAGEIIDMNKFIIELKQFISQTRKEAVEEVLQRVREEIIGEDEELHGMGEQFYYQAMDRNSMRRIQRKALDELVKSYSK